MHIPACALASRVLLHVLLLTSSLAATGKPSEDAVLQNASSWKPITSLYASLWTTELRNVFGVFERRSDALEAAAAAEGHNLTKVIGMLKQNGFDLVMSSLAWVNSEQSEGQLYLEDLTHIVDVVCNVHQLKLSIVVDTSTPPKWLVERYPDIHTKDSCNRTYSTTAIGHSLAAGYAYSFLANVADHLKSVAPAGCLHSMQPNWNNEYEAKITQEQDCFQDYSEFFEMRYRNSFRQTNSSLTFWNTRWNTTFRSWAEVTLPRYWQGDQLPDASSLYHDYLVFRDQVASRLLLKACGLLHQRGIDCLLHIPELYTVADPIYQSSMFWRLAKSAYVRYLVMDTNFMTAWGTENTPMIAKFLVSIGKAYRKKFVYFEAAFERFRNATGGGLRVALEAGVDGLGYTNWHGRVPNNTLKPAAAVGGGRALTCATPATTAVIAPHEMAMYIRGLNHSAATNASKDPVQEHVLGAFVRHAGGCGRGAHVFGDLAHFQKKAVLYTRLVNVQSPVLYKTSQQQLERLLAAAANASIPVHTVKVSAILRHPSLAAIPTIVDDMVWDDTHLLF